MLGVKLRCEDSDEENASAEDTRTKALIYLGKHNFPKDISYTGAFLERKKFPKATGMFHCSELSNAENADLTVS